MCREKNADGKWNFEKPSTDILPSIDVGRVATEID